MAPFARQARAAIAMDTLDMSFDATAAHHPLAEQQMTDIESALTQAGKCHLERAEAM
jgi:hypothetical protein